jgi:glycosyltransferase involved in cell wall biosynthesis
MSRRETISVVTPVHPGRIRNGLFAECLQSIHAQTLLPDAHCVAIDLDGEGAAPTRQKALMQARTDWVAFLDSDDLFLPRHLARMLHHAQEHELDFVYSWFKVLQDFGGGNRRVLEDDPIFPMTHYLNPWNPDDPIETTITVFVRTELAQSVGFQALDRGEANSGEDRFFTLGCMAAGAKIGHLVRKTWLWRHSNVNGVVLNTSGLPTKGDAV